MKKEHIKRIRQLEKENAMLKKNENYFEYIVNLKKVYLPHKINITLSEKKGVESFVVFGHLFDAFISVKKFHIEKSIIFQVIGGAVNQKHFHDFISLDYHPPQPSATYCK